MHGQIGQGDRRALDILPADIEHPGNRIERRYDHRIEAFLLQPFGNLPTLVGARSAGQRLVLQERRGGRGFGPVLPHCVDRIAVDRDQFGAALLQRLAHRLAPAARVQPRIEADARALLGILGQPLGHRILGHGPVFVEPAIDLVAYLQRVAAIDEDRCLLLQHCHAAGGAAEAGQPGQPLGIGADIFGQVLVAQRNNEAVEFAARKFLAQGGKAGFMGLHQHGT